MQSVDKYKQKETKILQKAALKYPNVSNQDLQKRYKADPVISKYHPQRYFGAISEKIEE